MILKTGILLAFLIVTMFAGAETLGDEDGACPKITDIVFDIRDVYEEDEDEPTLLESSLNFFHFTTRQEALQKELLFDVNDCLDREIIEETARNLRSLPIFSDAKIDIIQNTDNDDVRVLVSTKDRFTLRLEVSASHNAGTTKTRLSIGDKNLFGQNKSLHASRVDEDGETLSRYSYSDSRFFSDYALYASYTKARDGGLESYSLADPFRSLDDESAYFIAYNKNTQNFVFQLDNNEEIEIPQFYESESIGYTREFGTRKESKRFGFSFATAQQDYFSQNMSEQTSIPDRLEKVDLGFHASLSDRNEFIVMQGLDSLVYREDIELNRTLFFGLGVQRRDVDQLTEYHPKYQIGIKQTRYNHENVLSSYLISHAGRYYAGQLLESETTAFYHCYYLPKPGHVWLGGLTYQYRYGRDLLNESLTMGGDAGLRGYEASTFTGNKSLLFNLEYRHRLPSIWSKVAMGQAFFVDSGFAWKKGDDMRFADLKANVGWGLRFDVPSIFGRDILRFDLAVATDTGEVLASVTLGQLFRYNELTQNTQNEF